MASRTYILALALALPATRRTSRSSRSVCPVRARWCLCRPGLGGEVAASRVDAEYHGTKSWGNGPPGCYCYADCTSYRFNFTATGAAATTTPTRLLVPGAAAAAQPPPAPLPPPPPSPSPPPPPPPSPLPAPPPAFPLRDDHADPDWCGSIDADFECDRQSDCRYKCGTRQPAAAAAVRGPAERRHVRRIEGHDSRGGDGYHGHCLRTCGLCADAAASLLPPAAARETAVGEHDGGARRAPRGDRAGRRGRCRCPTPAPRRAGGVGVALSGQASGRSGPRTGITYK